MKKDLIPFLKQIIDRNTKTNTDIETLIKAIQSEQDIPIPTIPINESYPKPDNDLHIVVAAGHGGMNPKTGRYMTNPLHGKFYTFEETGETAFEGLLNRQVADKFCDLATNVGFKVHKVYHKFLDWDLPIITNSERRIVVNLPKNAKSIYISFHANANGIAHKGKSIDTKGWCCFVHRNPLSKIFSRGGYQVATEIEKAHRKIVKEENLNMGFRDAGDFFKEKQAIWTANFHETRETASPAVLIEGGFFTNLDEFNLIKSEKWQNATAKATVLACLELSKSAHFSKL